MIAEKYVKLVLAMGRHDPDYVDAYYGPPEWKEEAERDSVPLATLRARADSLDGEIHAIRLARSDTLGAMRQRYLHQHTAALVTRIRILQGEKLTFDEESQALYDAVAPRKDDAVFEPALATLDSLLPGKGPLYERYENFRKAFVIPEDRADTVFRAAIDEARRRTREHIALPDSETFTLEFVKNQPWSGYNWYQGGFRSLIQVNTDLPIYIDRAIDLACHEGYPGHHVYNALLEQHLVTKRGWIEFTVYPLFSPQSLIAEGTANFGIEVAFPGRERVAFERSRLFPLAGLDSARAAEYYDVMALVDQLSYAGNEAARRYLNGQIDAAAATAWLERYALMPHDRAAQRLRFFDQYRSYVINYNFGKDLVRKFIEARGGTPDHSDRRWREFEALLSSPRLPSGLR